MIGLRWGLSRIIHKLRKDDPAHRNKTADEVVKALETLIAWPLWLRFMLAVVALVLVAVVALVLVATDGGGIWWAYPTGLEKTPAAQVTSRPLGSTPPTQSVGQTPNARTKDISNEKEAATNSNSPEPPGTGFGAVTIPLELFVQEGGEKIPLKDEDTVGQQVDIEGQFGTKVGGWPVVLVQPLRPGQPWKAQPRVARFARGSFAAKVYFGDRHTSGTRFKVVVVLAKDQMEAYSNYENETEWQSLPDLPQSATITVMRGPSDAHGRPTRTTDRGVASPDGL